MKKFYIMTTTLFALSFAQAQQWEGSTGTIGNASRTGNVGIGTTSPTSKFSIKNTGGLDGVKLIDFSENDTEEFMFKGYFAGTGGAGNKLVLGTGIGLSGWQSSIMSWQGDGNVGIGVISPLEKLHIDNGALQFLNMGENINDVDIIKIGENASADEFTLQGMFAGSAESGNKIKFRSMWKDNLLVLQGDGKIGIDVADPESVLSIYGNNAAGWNSGIELNREGGGKGWIVVDGDGMKLRTPVDGDGFYFRDNDNNTSMFIKDGGNVGIGTSNPQNKLSVLGTIWAKEVKVSMTDAADWVFEDDYELMSLGEVERFVKKNRHLPEVPSADEFRENDLNVAEMDNLLLQKVEELTLYLIEQNKKIEALEAQNIKQNKEILKLKSRN